MQETVETVFFSVLIHVEQSKKEIIWLIQSLLDQSHTRYEIIVSSSEQVRESLIDDLERINARKKVKIIHSFGNKKYSFSEVLHRLSLQATGDVLCFVDSSNRRIFATPTLLQTIAELWTRSNLYCYALIPSIEKTGLWSLTKKIEEALLMFSYFVFNTKYFFRAPFIFLDSTLYFEKISIKRGSTMCTFKKQIFTILTEEMKKVKVEFSDTARETDKLMQTIISEQLLLFLQSKACMLLFFSSYLISGLLIFYGFWYALLLQFSLACLLRILCGFICNKKISHTILGLLFLPVLYVAVPFLLLSQILNKD